MAAREDTRFILLGIDGLAPDLLEAMMADGRLPAFRRVTGKGTYRRLTTINPPQSPVVWSTIATGSNPGHHGIFDYLARKPQDYLPVHSTVRLSQSNILARRQSTFLPVRKGTPFWEVTSLAKVPTSVIRYPLTFPPETVDGRMLSGLGVVDLQGTLGRYTFYTDDPTGAPDKKGDITRVSRQGNTIVTDIAGPNRSRVILEINIAPAGDRATFTIGDQRFDLRQGEWSDWVRMRFNLVFKQVSGICRFYLESLKPRFRLYATPVQIDPKDPAFPLSFPDGYATTLAQDIGMYATLGIPEDTNALSDGCIGDEAFIELCRSIMEERERMLWHELERFKEGLLVFVFDTTDRIQHIYWSIADAEHPAYDASRAARWGNIVSDYYCRMDAVLGKVLEAVDDRTVLCIVSDHGFGPFRRAVHVNSWLAQIGLLALKKPTQDSEGDPLFKNVAWERTRAYALGFTSVYLNLKGRESKGTVKPGEEAEIVKQKVAEALLSLRDPKTGRRVVHRVYRGEDLFTGACAAEAPDLVIGFAPGYRASWQTAIGGAPPKIIEDNLKRWMSDHICDAEFVPGVFVSNRTISGPSPTVKDIAPTILGCFGIAMPAEMEGRDLLKGTD